MVPISPGVTWVQFQLFDVLSIFFYLFIVTAGYSIYRSTVVTSRGSEEKVGEIKDGQGSHGKVREIEKIPE